MKLFELHMLESVTFSVAKLKMDDPKYPKGLFTSADYETKGEEDCWVCDGTGKETQREYTDDDGKHHPTLSYECGYCKGKKKIDKWITPYHELNVANGNAIAIVDVLGLAHGDEHDTTGHVEQKDLPALRRKLIKIKNGDFKELTSDSEQEQGKARRVKDEDGMDRISRGPKIHTQGRDLEQVKRYVDRLLDLIDFAQKNDGVLVWA